MRKIFKILANLILLAVAVGLIFYFQKPLITDPDSFYNRLNYVTQTEIAKFSTPCQKPLYYNLSAVDARFNMSDASLLSALKEASSIWSQAIGRDLFLQSSNGEILINFVYDYRQEASDKLKELGIVVSGDRKSYDMLKARYEALKIEYEADKKIVDSLIASFKVRQAAYEAEVAKWNSRGGAPEKEYERLTQTSKKLAAEAAEINKRLADLNVLGENLNAEGTMLNKLIDQLNLNVDRYNQVGGSIEKEFQEGVYAEGPEGKSITVYEFNDYDQLVRLLAHEMGHALGLEHTSSTGDIMYYLNEGENKSLSNNDLMQLEAACQIK